MIFSCKYNKSTGKILMWSRSANLGTANEQKKSNLIPVVTDVPIDLAFGVVSKFPKGLVGDGRPYIHRYLRVSVVNDNGTVEVEYVEEP